jgi:hypothetical protein
MKRALERRLAAVPPCAAWRKSVVRDHTRIRGGGFFLGALTDHKHRAVTERVAPRVRSAEKRPTPKGQLGGGGRPVR